MRLGQSRDGNGAVAATWRELASVDAELRQYPIGMEERINCRRHRSTAFQFFVGVFRT
jgi:hypothetical protein